MRDAGVKRTRLPLLIASLVLSAGLAYAARDLIFALVVVPISYVAWQLGVLLRAVPELVWWFLLVVIVALAIAWQLVPELKPTSGRRVRRLEVGGQVESVALWLVRARTSSYFKWQVAHRLGRVSRQMEEFVERRSEDPKPNRTAADFLAAGLNRSFVDFPTRRNPLRGPVATPLDADPGAVVAYLESRFALDPKDHGYGS